MTYEQIINDLKNKVYYPVYFLMGEEPFFIDQISKFISENVLQEHEKDFNLNILYSKDTDVFGIINEAKRYPMMANHNVVIIKEAQNIKDIEKLASYLENPQKSTLLVINYKYKKLDSRKTFSKVVQKAGVVFESKKLYDNQIPLWIVNYLKDKDLNITQKGAFLIAEYLGTDLSKIVNELNKLIIVLPKGTLIDVNHIEENIGISKDFNIFELCKALGTRNILKANQISNHLCANQKENPYLMNIIQLYNYFSKILLIHYVKDKSQNNIAAEIKIPIFFVKEYIEASANYSIKKLVNIIELLREFDAKGKGIDNSSLDETYLFRELIYRILH